MVMVMRSGKWRSTRALATFGIDSRSCAIWCRLRAQRFMPGSSPAAWRMMRGLKRVARLDIDLMQGVARVVVEDTVERERNAEVQPGANDDDHGQHQRAPADDLRNFLARVFRGRWSYAGCCTASGGTLTGGAWCGGSCTPLFLPGGPGEIDDAPALFGESDARRPRRPLGSRLVAVMPEWC